MTKAIVTFSVSSIRQLTYIKKEPYNTQNISKRERLILFMI